MNDLFQFLRNLVTQEPEVIAAFIIGVVVAVIFLALPIYKVAEWWLAKKVERLEGELASANEQLKTAETESADVKKKSKDRKEKLEATQTEIARLNAKLTESNQRAAKSGHSDERTRQSFEELQEKYSKVREKLGAADAEYSALAKKYNKLGAVAMSLKKQVVTLDDQAKLMERIQGNLWDIPVDTARLVPFRPLTKTSAVIIAMINLKGGVGKTTLTANLGATYAQALARRVLLVDLDFQQSLTNLCLPADTVRGLELGAGKLVDSLFKDPSCNFAAMAFSSHVPTRHNKVHVLACSENMANLEERSKARWLMNPSNLDLRCVLRSALHAPLFQENFDVILIDCPPRWTTSSINAMACCDYVLIPTQLDRVSTEAVPRLLKWLRNLRSASTDLYGHFQVLGVLGNLAFPRDNLIEQERIIWKALPEKCQDRWGAPVHHYGTIIRDKSDFRRAANRREFAALFPTLQPIFHDLVKEIEARRTSHEG